VDVVIVEDHAATLDGLRSAINAQPGVRDAGVASRCREGMVLVRQLRRQILILDLNLPDGNGWMPLEILRSGGCLPPTLVLSVCDESVYARGYLMKDVPLAWIL
jgi:DNA-binding NarL/FixJ family response regulator